MATGPLLHGAMSQIEKRKELKHRFREGALPTEEDFAVLIDSLAHIDEYNKLVEWMRRLEARLALDPSLEPAPPPPDDDDNGDVPPEKPGATPFYYDENGKVGLGLRDPISLLDVRGWIAQKGRLGSYEPYGHETETGRRGRHPSVPADGQWHVIVPHPEGPHAFEIVAYAGLPEDPKRQALTHAIAVTSYTTTRKGIRQARTRGGWLWRRTIRLKWRRHRRRWYQMFRGAEPADLCIRTGKDFGTDHKGRPLRLHYHITQLWDGQATTNDVQALEARGQQALEPAAQTPQLGAAAPTPTEAAPSTPPEAAGP